jgi:hypothetical protein
MHTVSVIFAPFLSLKFSFGEHILTEMANKKMLTKICHRLAEVFHSDWTNMGEANRF